MQEHLAIRYFMAGFFLVLGISLIAKRECFARAGGYFCRLSLEEPAQSRLIAAYRRRERSEALPSVWMATLLGACSLVMASLAFFTTAPVVLLYATLVLTLASVLTVEHARLQQSRRRRFASLRVRDAHAGAPWYIWGVVAATTVLPLSWLGRDPVASCLVALAGIMTALLARRVSSLPAHLEGEDVVVDTYVDTRLREARVTNLLGTAVAPGLVFEAFAGYTDSWLHICALLIAFVALGLTSVRLWLLVVRKPSRSEISTWFHAAT